MPNEYYEKAFARLYEQELDRMHKLDAQAAVPAATITVLGGVCAWYLHNGPAKDLNVWGWLYWMVVVLAILALVVGTVLVIRSYIGNKYELVADPDRLKTYLDQTTSYYNENYPADAKDRTLDAFQDLLIRGFADAGFRNRQTNLTRSRLLYLGFAWVAAALVPLLLAIILFLLNKPEKVQKIQLAQSEPTKVEVTNQPVIPNVVKVEVANEPKVRVSNLPGVLDVKVLSIPEVQKTNPEKSERVK